MIIFYKGSYGFIKWSFCYNVDRIASIMDLLNIVNFFIFIKLS